MSTTDTFHPENTIIPRHVGIIPDGGRRWAQSKGCSLTDSYNKTKVLIRDMVIFLTNSGVFEISIYLSSIQNFRRSAQEVEAFINVSTFAFQNDILILAREKKLRINIAGNRKAIPETFLKAIDFAESETRDFKKGKINILVAYNPVDEIIEATMKSNNPEDFLKNLWVTTPIDLVIRSGGADLLSNFLPLQSGFARLIFIDKLFNDLTINDLKQILKGFFDMERKFGD
jgi:undecaprenyl diphosphate synthase